MDAKTLDLINKLTANNNKTIIKGHELTCSFDGKIKIIATSEAKQTKLNEKYKELQTYSRTISFIPLTTIADREALNDGSDDGAFVSTSTRAWKETIFERDMPLLFSTIKEAEEYGLKERNGMFPGVKGTTVQKWDVVTNQEYYVVDNKGEYLKDVDGLNVTSNVLTIFVFPDSEKLQTKLRRKLRQLKFTTQTTDLNNVEEEEDGETAEEIAAREAEIRKQMDARKNANKK